MLFGISKVCCELSLVHMSVLFCLTCYHQLCILQKALIFCICVSDSNMNLNPDVMVTEHELIFHNVNTMDSKVIQCNVTNKHGYIFSNAYLNVTGESVVFPIFYGWNTKVWLHILCQNPIINCNILSFLILQSTNPQSLLSWWWWNVDFVHWRKIFLWKCNF